MRDFKPFYAVQFIKLPFGDIENYVCVPGSWVIVIRESDQRGLVVYPNDNKPLETRDRVRRNCGYERAWKSYEAIIKYGSDTYEDARRWINTRNDYRPFDLIVEESPRMPRTSNANQNRPSASHQMRRKQFYAVQFIELPFEGIDNYVCIPNSWLIVNGQRDQKAVVAYPKEHPFVTKDRVRRKEGYHSEWTFYMATVKYESDTYRDVELWIARRNDNGPFDLITEESPRMPRTSNVNQNHPSASHQMRRKQFYAVQFIELPFEGIDNYVCIPDSWLIVNRQRDQKAVVAYPKEHPFVTKGRVRRKEGCHSEWRFYMATVKYESDTYRDVELWIDRRNDNGLLIEADSTMEEPQRMPVSGDVNQNRHSESHHPGLITHPCSEPRPRLTIDIYKTSQGIRVSIKRRPQPEQREPVIEKRSKVDEAVRILSAVSNVFNKMLEPETGSSKREQRNFFHHNQFKKENHTDRNPQIKHHSEGEKQPGSNNGNNQKQHLIDHEERSQLHSEPKSAIAKFFEGMLPVEDPQPGCSRDIIQYDQFMNSAQMEDHSLQSSQTNANSQRNNLLDSGHSSLNIQPQRTESDDENIVTMNLDPNPRINHKPNDEQSTPSNQLKSQKMIDNLYSQIEKARRLVPMHKPIEKRIRAVNAPGKKSLSSKIRQK